MQTSKAGFPTKAAAQSALQEAVRTVLVDVQITDVLVSEYLTTWPEGKHALKPTTVALYSGLSKNYLIPHLGHVHMLDLRAHHLDRMYASIQIGREANSSVAARSGASTACCTRH